MSITIDELSFTYENQNEIKIYFIKEPCFSVRLSVRPYVTLFSDKILGKRSIRNVNTSKVNIIELSVDTKCEIKILR